MVIALGAALLLQIAGSVISVWEVWQGHRRWKDKFGSPQPASGRVEGKFHFGGWAVGETTAPDDLTLEEQIERLAERQKLDHEAVNRRIHDLETSVPSIAADAASKVESRRQPQIAESLGYLAGMGKRHKWMPWWLGPSLLILGTLIGGVASLVDAYCD